jgi:raffinose/stachyose/melibiose transport system substrate-binding protein
MCYNKAIFKKYGLEVPKTVEDLKHVVEILSKTEYIPIAVGAKDGWCAAMMFEGFAYSVDPQITSKIVNGEAHFSDIPYAEATKVMRELLEMGAFSKNVALTGIDEALPLFESGKAAMMANGSWEVAPGSMKMGDDFGYFYYPVINSEDIDKYGQNCAGGLKDNSGYMVYSGTKHPKEATQIALALAQLSSQWLYEISGDPMLPFLPEKLGWKNEKGFSTPVAQLAKDQQNFKFVYGLVQDVMPTAAASSGVMENTSKFMASYSTYTNEEYLADMDKAAREE